MTVNIPDEMLLSVEKPARYTGGEVNMAVKNPSEAEIRFGFCFPDIYEIGMSHLGLSVLYWLINNRDDSYCERFFAPWIDMEQIMRENKIPLFSLETFTEAKDFDILGFTLQYEMSCTNILNMLDLAEMPIYASERGDDFPIVCAGGPCAYNPEPFAEFFDFFYIGEAEAVLNDILDIYKTNKAENCGKRHFLEKISTLKGVYVPAFYDVEYKSDGTIKSFTKNYENASDVIEKVIVEDLETSFFPETQIVPFIETVHDRVTVELFRGCIRGCRFCQAGYIYRPVRERSAKTLTAQTRKLVASTGHEEISLLSLSTGDYTEFQELSEALIDEHSKNGVGLSLPSMRVDAFSLELMGKIQGVRKSSLTFAPEAGSQRLRDVINKNLSEEEILGGCRLAFEGGWDRVKLYFMTGLPNETDDDLRGIAELCYKILRERINKPININASASCFVPKPFTPFQWVSQNTIAEFSRKNYFIKENMGKKIKFNYHSPEVSVLEGLIARGDRRAGKVIAAAHRLGARFDGWNDKFSREIWNKAAEEAGVDTAFYTERKRDYDEILPWDHISIGISKDFFIRESEKALNGETTPNCREGCGGCGLSC